MTGHDREETTQVADQARTTPEPKDSAAPAPAVHPAASNRVCQAPFAGPSTPATADSPPPTCCLAPITRRGHRDTALSRMAWRPPILVSGVGKSGFRLDWPAAAGDGKGDADQANCRLRAERHHGLMAASNRVCQAPFAGPSSPATAGNPPPTCCLAPMNSRFKTRWPFEPSRPSILNRGS